MKTNTIEGGAFLTLDELKRANIRAGAHWFDESTLHYFDGQIHSLYGGRFVVHSSQFHGSLDSAPRQYHIAYATADGKVESLPGEKTVTLDFASQEGAESFARLLEAGRLRIEKFQYDKHRQCRSCLTFASWILNGDILCHQHFGVELEAWRERL